MNNSETGCKSIMKCMAVNDMDCTHYQPSDNVESEMIPCIYRTEKGNCNNIIATQKAILENISYLFDTMDETIIAKQTAIDMYDEKREMQIV